MTVRQAVRPGFTEVETIWLMFPSHHTFDSGTAFAFNASVSFPRLKFLPDQLPLKTVMNRFLNILLALTIALTFIFLGCLSVYA